MQTEFNYDDPAKAVAWTAYWEGYKEGRHIGHFKAIHKKTANSLFEEWWRINAPE